MEISEEDYEFLQKACEEGDGQAFHEMTEIDLGTMSVIKVNQFDL